jgi:predicted membrane protein
MAHGRDELGTAVGIVAASVTIATDEDFSLAVRLLWTLPTILVGAAAAIFALRALRSRGRRVAPRGKTGGDRDF